MGEYKVVRGSTQEQLESRVKQLQDEGWVLVGGVSVGGAGAGSGDYGDKELFFVWAQAMTK